MVPPGCRHGGPYQYINLCPPLPPQVAWRPPARAADRIDHYKLLMSTSTGVVKDVCQGKLDRYRVTGLRASTEYVFCVKAVFDDGSHMWSESKAYATRHGGAQRSMEAFSALAAPAAAKGGRVAG